MRIGILSISHESNTFMPTPTTLDDFRRGTLLTGQSLSSHYANSHHEIAGFLQGLQQNHLTPVPLLAARATPSGTITAETLDTLLEMMFQELSNAGPLDALLVAPHGAGVSEPELDMDGHWLSLLRSHFPTSPFPHSPFPIFCTLDPHANLTPRMISSCTATIAYRTNPHLDQRARGLEAANLLARTLRREINPTQAASFPPFAINIERQLTASSPCKELYALADDILKRPGVLSNSIFLGFPYADVPEMGSSFVVVTDNDPPLAQKYADELAAHLWSHRQDFVGHLLSPPDAITQALQSPKPVCLLDMGDNVGGGGPADSTTLAHLLHQQHINSFICLYDPPAVSLCQQSSPGSRLTLSMGAHTPPSPFPTSPLPPSPLTTPVTLLSLHDGQFTESEPRHGGATTFNIGPTAIVRTDSNLTIQLTTRRAQPTSLNQMLSCNLDPKSFDIIVVKGVHAPVAAYAPVCPTLIRANTPGITTADMTSLPYHHRRKPLFPFESP
jgi:microcystin degradation protein MlrC